MSNNDQHIESQCPSGHHLANYAKGTADAVISRQIETHLLDCPLCDSAVEGLRQHPLLSTTQLRQMSQTIVASSTDELSPANRTPRLFVTLVAAAIVIGLLFFGWNAYHQAQAPDRVFAEFFDPNPKVPFSGQRALSAVRQKDPVLNQAIRYHLDGEYAFALSSWRSYLEDNANPDPKAYLYAAGASMATRKYELAEYYLEQLPPQSTGELGADTDWYRLLLTLKTRGVEEGLAEAERLSDPKSDQRLTELRQRLSSLLSASQ
jgi:hypothetical protein